MNNTTLSGKMYFDFTNIDQKNSDTGSTNANGTGIDVKRFYLIVDHKFDDIWSANLTTDFNYVSNDGETNLFVKKAYVEGKFDPAFKLRIGSADMPWIPFVENYYGFRYVENTLTDRLKYANSADWGLHAAGDFGASKTVNYAVSVVNGNGYKNPSRSKGVDVEGRVGFVPVENMIIAVGGYSGHRGQETQNGQCQQHRHPWRLPGGLRRQDRSASVPSTSAPRTGTTSCRRCRTSPTATRCGAASAWPTA